MPFGLLMIGLQIAVAVHAARTGRMNPWLWIVIFVPGLGCLLYVIIELVPEWMQGRGAQRLRSTATRAIDPGRRYRELARAAEIAPTVQNKMNLAEEALRLDRAQEAVELYQDCATGLHASDPGILAGLARARFAAGDAMGTLSAIQALRAEAPDYRKHDLALLYSRALDAEGRTEDARRAYAELAGTYPGEEARARYAELLARLGDVDAARSTYREIVRRVELQGRAYKVAQRPWYDIARQAVGATHGGKMG